MGWPARFAIELALREVGEGPLRRLAVTAGVAPVYLHTADGRLVVPRATADGYLVMPRATAGERVRAEPFDAIELEVAVLLGDDRRRLNAKEREQAPIDASGGPS